MGTHLHHIIPKHMGGTDDPSNLVELTVEEHAEAHRKLYEEHRSIYDFVAWKALSGQITSDEARRLAAIATWTGRNHTEEAKEKIREARLTQVPPNKGRKFSEEHRKKISENQKNTPKSAESNEKRSKTMSGIAKPKVKCPHCGKEGGLQHRREHEARRRILRGFRPHRRPRPHRRGGEAARGATRCRSPSLRCEY